MSIYQAHAIGDHEFSEHSWADFWKEYIVGEALFGTGTTYKIPLEIGDYVLEVAVHVTTAFTSATSPTMTVGDGDGADVYFAAADLTMTTLNYFKRSVMAGQTAEGGKYYPSGGYILLTLNETPTAGAMKVLVKKLRLDRNWRLTASGV